MTVELEKLFKAVDMKPEWLGILAGRCFQVPLPTEVVVKEAGFFVPRMARWYWTNLYFYNGEIMDADGVKERSRKLTGQFYGLSVADQIRLYEVYHDDGSDGHVYYEMVGYRFSLEKEPVPPDYGVRSPFGLEWHTDDWDIYMGRDK